MASTAPYAEAVIARRIGYAGAMAGVAASVFLLAAVLTAVGKERRGMTFGE